MDRKKNTLNTFGFDDIREQKNGKNSYKYETQIFSNDASIKTITYEAPFDRCDRVEDYKTAWEFFEREGIN